MIIGGLLSAVSGALGFAGVPFCTAMTVFTTIALASTVWLLVWTLRGAAAGQRAAAQIDSADPPASD